MAGLSLLLSPQRQWRGRSGRIYDAIALGITEAAHSEHREQPALAIGRDKGFAVQVTRPSSRITPEWTAKAGGRGAVEIHALLLDSSEAEAALEDLRVMR